MLSYFYLAIFSIFFFIITWKKFHWGLFIFFLLLPTYLIRFNIGPLPTTLLEVMLWLIVINWLVQFRHSAFCNLQSAILKNKLLFIGIGLFLLSATISLFTSTNLRAALGEWKAFYIEPILVFVILITTIQQYNNKTIQSKISNFKFQISKWFPLWQRGGFERPARFALRSMAGGSEKTGCVGYSAICNPACAGRLQSAIIFTLTLSGLATSLLAIYQHFTGWLVPYAFWQNHNTFRVTAWYGFPNAVGLFLAPLVPLAIYLAKQSLNNIKNHVSHITYHISQLVCSMLYVICSMIAIYFSKGTGPLLGVIAGLILILLFYKKTRWPIIVVGLISVIGLITLPQLSSVKNEIFFGDRSGQIRLQMWEDTLKFLSDHPLAGAGLASYTEKIVPYHSLVNGEKIEIFHHPHNIFLTMWVNLGLLGLVSFILIIISLFLIPCLAGRQAYSLFKQSHNTYHVSHNNTTIQQYNNTSIYFISSMVTILVMGLVDSPYIKNDLSILFWLLPALLIISVTQAFRPDVNK